MALTLLTALAALTACGGEEAEEPAAEASEVPAVDARLSDTYDACRTGSETRDLQLALADEGQTLEVDTNPDDFEYGDTPGGLVCVLEKLDVPQSLISKIERTTAMTGVQEESHDGLDFSWTYHPDNGTELLITVQESGSS